MRDALANHAGITVRDLYLLYPDFRIRPEHVAEEQRLLLEHDAIVFSASVLLVQCARAFKGMDAAGF